MNTEQMKILLDPDTREYIRLVAKLSGRSSAAVVREMVLKYIELHLYELRTLSSVSIDNRRDDESR